MPWKICQCGKGAVGKSVLSQNLRDIITKRLIKKVLEDGHLAKEINHLYSFLQDDEIIDEYKNKCVERKAIGLRKSTLTEEEKKELFRYLDEENEFMQQFFMDPRCCGFARSMYYRKIMEEKKNETQIAETKN